MAARLQNVAGKVLAAAGMAWQAAEPLEEEVADVAEDVPACFFFCMSRLGLTSQRLCDAGPGLWPGICRRIARSSLVPVCSSCVAPGI